MLGTAATNCTTLTEWDGPLLLCRHIFSHNGGVKQNICGALHILLENQFRSFFLLAFIFNIFLTYIFFRKNMQSDQRSEWSETITADDERESKTRTSIERFSLHFGSSRKEWYPPAPFSPLAPDFLIPNFFLVILRENACDMHAEYGISISLDTNDDVLSGVICDLVTCLGKYNGSSAFFIQFELNDLFTLFQFVKQRISESCWLRRMF